MKEETKSYLKYGLRVLILCFVFAVFLAFSAAFMSLWGKSIMVGVFAAYAFVLLSKWGVIEWMQVHGSGLIAEMASCDFCLSWWLCVVLCFGGWVVSGGWGWLPAAFVGTMICRVLK